MQIRRKQSIGPLQRSKSFMLSIMDASLNTATASKKLFHSLGVWPEQSTLLQIQHKPTFSQTSIASSSYFTASFRKTPVPLVHKIERWSRLPLTTMSWQALKKNLCNRYIDPAKVGCATDGKGPLLPNVSMNATVSSKEYFKPGKKKGARWNTSLPVMRSQARSCSTSCCTGPRFRQIRSWTYPRLCSCERMD